MICLDQDHILSLADDVVREYGLHTRFDIWYGLEFWENRP